MYVNGGIVAAWIAVHVDVAGSNPSWFEYCSDFSYYADCAADLKHCELLEKLSHEAY